MNRPPRAALLNAIPGNRYRTLTKEGRMPMKGDIVVIDQGYTDDDGMAMVIAYFQEGDGTFVYEAEVYESELGPDVDS